MMLDASDITTHALDADLCIVGAGAAGISLALQFARSTTSVILIESGGRGHDDRTQQLYAGEVADTHMHPPLDHYRERRFGGSTSTWGGRCIPFDPIDFERRDYLGLEGWPISYADLLPYYERANQLCEAGPFQYNEARAFEQRPPPMISGFSSRDFSDDSLERFSRPTDFGKRYGQRLRDSANVRVVLHANATHLQMDRSGERLQAVKIRSFEGNHFVVRAKLFVLACGGLETVRLLLASRDVHSQGVGNAYDQVGRYYMSHLAGTIGSLRFKPGVTVHHGYDRGEGGVYCRRRLALRPEAQRRLGVGNFIARLHHPRITDPVHRSGALSLLYLAKPLVPYEYAVRLHGDDEAGWRRWLAHLGNVLRDPLQVLAFSWQMTVRRSLVRRKFPSIIVKPRNNRFSLDFHAEQLPNGESRVSLCDSLDEFGVPKLRVDWRYCSDDVATVERALAALARALRDNDTGRFDYDRSTVEQEMVRYGAYGGHHIGTARMASSARSGVVDERQRVHGVQNLYVSSAAVFPTSSQANPTLTIVALSLRLADHLRQQLMPAQSLSFAAVDTRERAA